MFISPFDLLTYITIRSKLNNTLPFNAELRNISSS